MKHRNTTSREKKKMFKTLSSDAKKHKVSRNKNMFGSIYKKKTEQKFGGYLYKYGLLRCFHKWAVSKRKKKKKKKCKAKNHTNMMFSRNN